MMAGIVALTLNLNLNDSPKNRWYFYKKKRMEIIYIKQINLLIDYDND